MKKSHKIKMGCCVVALLCVTAFGACGHEESEESSALPAMEEETKGAEEQDIDSDQPIQSESPEEPEYGSEPVIFRFAGDISLAEEGAPGLYMANMQYLDSEYNGDLTRCFSENLMELMQSADIFMLNNEFTYSERGTPVPGKDWTFRATPGRVEQLVNLGVDLVGLANNHAFDWGEDALLDTMATLDEAGIDRVGAGENLAEAMEAVYYTLGGRTFAIVAATAPAVEKPGASEGGMTRAATETEPGVLATYDPADCLEAIRTAKASSDYVFVYVHWGTEMTTVLDPEQKELARAYIDAGADAVIGNHPHILQGFEYYQGKPVLYSMGNFWFNSKKRETCLLEFSIDPASLETQVRFLPCLQNNFHTSVITDSSERERMISEMESISVNVQIGEDGVVTEVLR